MFSPTKFMANFAGVEIVLAFSMEKMFDKGVYGTRSAGKISVRFAAMNETHSMRRNCLEKYDKLADFGDGYAVTKAMLKEFAYQKSVGLKRAQTRREPAYMDEADEETGADEYVEEMYPVADIGGVMEFLTRRMLQRQLRMLTMTTNL